MVTVYVDEIKTYARVAPAVRRFGRRWCHMTADSPEELHEMAAAIGLKREYFQSRPGPNRNLDHYDLIPPKRAMAIKHGAVEETLQQFMDRMRRAR